MNLALLGATGRTGIHAMTAALDRGHQVAVLVRDAEKLPSAALDRVRVVIGDSTDPADLSELLAETDAVVSALGPVGKQPDLHTRTARALVQIMATTGPRRFVGVSGAGIDVPGDRKATKDKIISKLIQASAGKWSRTTPRVLRMGRQRPGLDPHPSPAPRDGPPPTAPSNRTPTAPRATPRSTARTSGRSSSTSLSTTCTSVKPPSSPPRDRKAHRRHAAISPEEACRPLVRRGVLVTAGTE